MVYIALSKYKNNYALNKLTESVQRLNLKTDYAHKSCMIFPSCLYMLPFAGFLFAAVLTR